MDSRKSRVKFDHNHSDNECPKTGRAGAANAEVDQDELRKRTATARISKVGHMNNAVPSISDSFRQELQKKLVAKRGDPAQSVALPASSHAPTNSTHPDSTRPVDPTSRPVTFAEPVSVAEEREPQSGESKYSSVENVSILKNPNHPNHLNGIGRSKSSAADTRRKTGVKEEPLDVIPKTKKKSGLSKLAFWSKSKSKTVDKEPTKPKKEKQRSSSFSAQSRRLTNAGKLDTSALDMLENSSFNTEQDVIALKSEGSYYAHTREEATNFLSQYDMGTYLLRPNSDYSNFCLSYVVETGKVQHTEIRQIKSEGGGGGEDGTAQSGFQLAGKSDRCCKSLLDIVNMGRQEGFFITSASGSRLKFFLISPPNEGAKRCSENRFNY